MDPLLISIAAFVAVAALVGVAIFVMGDFGGNNAEVRLEVLTDQRAAGAHFSGHARRARVAGRLRRSGAGTRCRHVASFRRA